MMKLVMMRELVKRMVMVQGLEKDSLEGIPVVVVHMVVWVDTECIAECLITVVLRMALPPTHLSSVLLVEMAL